MRWTQSYGKDTVEAATLTPAHFRDGEAEEVWAEKTHKVLAYISYGHLGGIIESETISGEVATVTLKARIVAIDGISTQTEIYMLKQVSGQWLLEDLEVRDEVVPVGKLPFTF